MRTPTVETEPRKRPAPADDITTPTFRTLNTVGVVKIKNATAYKPGAEIRVEVKVNPSGRLGIDVRRYDTRALDVTAKAHEGPTNKGLWLSTIDAELVAELLAGAVVVAESIDVDSEGMVTE